MTRSHQPSRARTWGVFLIIIVLLIIVWLIFWRRTAAEPDVNATPPFTANVLSPAPVPINTSGLHILFQDNFDQSIGTWEMSKAGQADDSGQVMYLEDSEIEGAAVARPHLRFQDFVLDVDSRWLGGSVGGTYGLRFRMTETGEFLGFYLHNDGWYNVVKNDGEVQETLYEAFSTAVRSAGEANHIRIEAKGDNFRFFLNDTYLVDVQASAPQAGDIMLVAQKVEGTNSFQVGFDNLTLTLHP